MITSFRRNNKSVGLAAVMRHLVTYTFTSYQKYETGDQNFCVRYCCK